MCLVAVNIQPLCTPTHPPTCFSYQEWHRKGLGFTTLAIKNGIYRKGLGFTTYVYVTSRSEQVYNLKQINIVVNNEPHLSALA